MRSCFRFSLLMVATVACGAEQDREYEIEDTAYTVEPGRFAVELTPLAYARRSATGTGDVDTQAWSFGYSLLRAGVARDTEIGVAFESWHSSRTFDPVSGTHNRDHGTGCVALRMKQNFLGNDHGNPALAFAPYVRFPTGTGSHQIAGSEWGFALPADIAFPDRWSGVAVIYGDWLSNSLGSGRHFESSMLLNATRALNEAWCVFAECYYQVRPETGASPIGTLDVGVGRSFPHDIYIEIGAMFGVTRAADDLAGYLTLARRF